ncbi:hypothetical protein A2W14_01700 [Candidatus Gottesmanbacteria bacterium RBG_16_37_8]|uniref:Uncharacterized protein n=1 Tax=Candidatus Gottesmanbacteria bacterium RBG_16_37_8 TaxID=1798371 RepID=A0A1F5YQY2_9BACT|nr:MAG: hypothetical protein A2W14_01700 [Candidatus Gottesmanbacteria bacterium RBG_16_37_8]
MPKIFKLLILILFLSPFFFIRKSLAASINLDSPNLSILADINSEYEINVVLSINAADNTRYYLRGIFYKEGTNKYCGYTWNGQNWFNGPYSAAQGWENLPSVSVSSDSGKIKIKAKLDINDSDCQSQGIYGFKIQRYTQGGSAIIDDQNEQRLEVKVLYATPTSNPTTTRIPALTVVKSKTEEKIIKPTLTAAQIKSSIVETYPQVINQKRILSSSSVSLNDSSLASSSPVSASISSEKKYLAASVAGIIAKKSFNYAVLPLILGLGLIFSASVISFRQIKKSN